MPNLALSKSHSTGFKLQVRVKCSSRDSLVDSPPVHLILWSKTEAFCLRDSGLTYLFLLSLNYSAALKCSCVNAACNPSVSAGPHDRSLTGLQFMDERAPAVVSTVKEWVQLNLTLHYTISNTNRNRI